MLKRAFLTLAVIAGMAVTATAQGIVPVDDVDFTASEDPIGGEVLKPYALSTGPKVGVNYSIAGDPDGIDLGISGNIGFSAGVAANLRFGRPAGRPFGTERFGVQLEALYAMHSLHSDVENITMHCFEIPVLFQWYFIPTFAIEFGPTFTGAFSTSPKELPYNDIVFQMDKVKAYDVMLSIGVNCKLKNGFTADLRYNLGNSDMAGNFKTKVSTISLGIGWLFSVIK
ncbi:MAG: PorT family protein [Pseudoflavonifractor sp.]|nr:PorT family protein [Pseudoflavonifractor sp.]